MTLSNELEQAEPLVSGVYKKVQMMEKAVRLRRLKEEPATSRERYERVSCLLSKPWALDHNRVPANDSTSSIQEDGNMTECLAVTCLEPGRGKLPFSEQGEGKKEACTK